MKHNKVYFFFSGVKTLLIPEMGQVKKKKQQQKNLHFP